MAVLCSNPSLLIRKKETQHNTCSAEDGHQNDRSVPLHWHSQVLKSPKAPSSSTIFSFLLCLRIQIAHTHKPLDYMASCLKSTYFFRLPPSPSSPLPLYSISVLHTSLLWTWVMNAMEKKIIKIKPGTTLLSKSEKTGAYTGNTHLQSHWDILLADIMVVLVSVQHNNCIGQGKAGITISKWGSIWFLKDNVCTI